MSRLQRDEAGMTLVDLLISSAIATVVLAMVSTSVYVATSTARHSINQSNSISPALFATQQAQQILSSAWTPATGVAGVTDDCASNSTGGTFASGNGPFVTGGAQSSEIEFCSFNLGSTIAYTYDLYLSPKGCESEVPADCTGLELDQWPAAGCSGSSCQVIPKWFISGVDDVSGTPFTYLNGSGGSLASTSTRSQIQVIELDLSVPANTGSAAPINSPGTTVQRDVELSNSLGGMS